MIQRIQTLWMILAAAIIFITLKVPFYAGTLLDGGQFHKLLATDYFIILILTSALGTGMLINIFLYKHRSIQSRIIIVSIILECLIVFLYIKQTTKYSTGNYTLWSALHIFIFIFFILAARGIYKDSKLIKDSNRLR